MQATTTTKSKVLDVISLDSIRKNCMGTISFNMMYKGMRKVDDFIVYPKSSDDTDSVIIIQSGRRFGKLDLNTGKSIIAVGDNANSITLSMQIALKTAKCVMFTPEQCQQLKERILGTYSSKAGTNGIMYSDNTGVIGLI